VCSSDLDNIEKNEMGGACSAYGGEERCIQGLVGKPGGKRPLGRPRHRWEDNIKMNLQEVGKGIWTESSGENFIIRNLRIGNPHPIFCGR
jgi:hypothetical protein